MNRPLLELRADLQRILRAGVDAVEPGRLVRAALARLDLPDKPTHVVAAGKAAGQMFAAAAPVVSPRAAVVATYQRAEERLHGDIEWFEAGHPAPNAASVAAAVRALALAHRSNGSGGLLVLLSGGASAMLCAPEPGVALAEKTETARILMQAGAAIHELNCVRKHLSRIKGGRLAAAAGRTIALALSDVHGPIADDPSVIGSGPTVADETTFGDALDVIRRRAVEVPAAVRNHLERGARGEVEETLKPGDPRLRGSVYSIVGNRATAAAGAALAAEQAGYLVVEVAGATGGEARHAAAAFLDEARRATAGAMRPMCVIASGETTVTVQGTGRGGRNQEFALAAAPTLAAGGLNAVLGSAGTDGIDGPTDAAGALVDPTTLSRAARGGLDWDASLAANDAYHFFAALDDLIRWGPTGTNVGDLHVLLTG